MARWCRTFTFAAGSGLCLSGLVRGQVDEVFVVFSVPAIVLRKASVWACRQGRRRELRQIPWVRSGSSGQPGETSRLRVGEWVLLWNESPGK